MRVISTLRMKPFVLDDWQQLPLPGKLVGEIGQPTSHLIRSLTGFAQRVRTGYYGRGRQVQAATVTGAITAVGQTISLAIGHNPTKVIGSDKFLPALQVMIDGFAMEDPPTRKMLPVESDVPELLVEIGYSKSGTAHTRVLA